MTIVRTLDEIAAWLEQNVCADVNLKPHSFDDQTRDYPGLIHPYVFSLYAPTGKTKPPDVKATVPSICVQIVDGADEVFTRDRTMKLRLSFSAWDPGIHPQDVYLPADGSGGFGAAYIRGGDDEPSHGAQVHSGGEKKRAHNVTLTHTGWRDVWNFVDVALRAIETARSIAGYVLDPKTPIRWGVYDEDGAIADYYPFWFAWAELAVKQEVIVPEPSINDLL